MTKLEPKLEIIQSANGIVLKIDLEGGMIGGQNGLTFSSDGPIDTSGEVIGRVTGRWADSLHH